MIEAAAGVALFGMDPMEFLRSKDPLVRGTMQAIAARARELQRQLDRERANLNAAEMMKMLAAGIKR